MARCCNLSYKIATCQFMSEPSHELLLQFLKDFTNLDLIPASLTPALGYFYTAIACDEDLRQQASNKCSQVLEDLTSHSAEVVKRCSQFYEVLLAHVPPPFPNLIIGQVDVNGTTDMPVLSPHQHLTNLIIEDIDVTQYISD